MKYPSRYVPVSLALLACGCSDEDTVYLQGSSSDTESTEATQPNLPGGSASDTAGGDPANESSDTRPLYAVMYEIFDDVGSNSYLSLIEDLDIDAIDPAQSREYAGGRAYLRTYNGWVFVGEPTAPNVRRYSVSAAGELVDERVISFGNFGLDSGAIDSWSLTFVSPDKAYLFDGVQGTTIVWDPMRMEIRGAIEAPAEFIREGLSLNSSPGVLRDNRLYRSIFWANFDTAAYSADHLLAIYDVETDTLIESVPETRCPAPGNLAHMDEGGNIYFSNWIWPIAGTLMRGAPRSCVLRVPAGSDRFDPDWTLSFADVANGREGGMFTYVGEGRGLISIFDDTRISFDAATDPWAYAGSGNWSIWTVELESRAASPLPGIPLNAGAYTPALLDDRLFLIVPEEGWASANVYEVEDGAATPGLAIPGWSYALEKVR